MLNSQHDSFGAQNAGGGAIGIEAVKSIPLLSTGEQNPVANDTESQVPQAPAKPIEREKEEKVSPNAVALKMKLKKRPADVASEHQKFRPFKEPHRPQSSFRHTSSAGFKSPVFADAGLGPHRDWGQHYPRHPL